MTAKSGCDRTAAALTFNFTQFGSDLNCNVSGSEFAALQYENCHLELNARSERILVSGYLFPPISARRNGGECEALGKIEPGAFIS